MQFKRGHNALTGVNICGGWGELLSSLSLLCWSHAGRVLVENSNLPSLIKVIKNDFYALRVIKVYLYEPKID